MIRNSKLTLVLATCLVAGATFVPTVLFADEEGHPLAGLPMRSIGPALTSGRIADFAFHPEHWRRHYVAMASGNLWSTDNNGITWKSLFNNEGAYALGVVEIDPRREGTVWVGTGENNSQRSVGFGDGVYRSQDGGQTWENMGLGDSGHISMIRIHPEDSDTVWVAAQGPLWNSGGDRGLYRTTDGGKKWERILEIDPDTGVNEFVVHPDDADVIVASSYQRRRHVWTLINGGPGSGVHKTTDGGKTWREVTKGLPGGDKGRIGLAMAPSAPHVLYAIVEASADKQGVFRSTDFGESWEKRSGHMTSSPQYYNELVVDPNNPDVLYSLDTFTHRSEDGGKTWERLSIKNRHVDDHALWIDPDNSDHLYIGGDGGVYESWDYGESWRHVQNLPVTQFYRATPDNDEPFYNVCAGTQDNFTLCGPSRTPYTDGITNADWWIAQFGDGFKAQIDPTDANVVYAQAQYGSLARFDRVSGERLSITPHPPAGQDNYKWNWNAPLIISPHDPNRLYYGAERLLRSDDRGASWVEISGDLSRQLDRNALEVMGRVWSSEAIAKNASTSMYGALIAVDESPLAEGLIYAGTDDGLIHVTTDGGQNWRRIESFRTVPSMSLVEDIIASRHDVNVAYAVFDNHKRGDHKPYILKTSDQGASWSLVVNGLPERGTVHTLAEDHVNPGLLFAGTEFGVFFTSDGGGQWHELTSLPTIAVRDLEIQRRENDLVIGTFGRGVYILDDYSPLRISATQLAESAVLFQPRPVWMFNPDSRRGWGGKGDFGTGRYTAENPPHGAVISYHLPESYRSLSEQRREAEKERAKADEDNPYPSWDQFRAEDRERDPSVVVTVTDQQGEVIRRLQGPASKGFHQVTWDMRYAAPDPVSLNPRRPMAPWESDPQGPMVVPGSYSVKIELRQRGELTPLAGPVNLTLRPLFDSSLTTDDPAALLSFQQRTSDLYRVVMGANRAADEIDDRIEHLLKAANDTASSGEETLQALLTLEQRMRDLRVVLNGDRSKSRRYEPVPMSLTSRIGMISGGSWNSRSPVTGNHRDSLGVVEDQLPGVLQDLGDISEALQSLEKQMEGAGAPWTPARIPEFPG